MAKKLVERQPDEPQAIWSWIGRSHEYATSGHDTKNFEKFSTSFGLIALNVDVETSLESLMRKKYDKIIQ